ncbi:recombinase family protein [Aldersonia sp. NBC_00410]|uniref:recombinase family protein n=1 Tax=Aldersonia sp. NBC_00410 TaxID=2975954 RepID=UPI00224F4C39|nr:recombinase family protein [Aldersonia sp. NBC_00410]MCX5042465.1 recombinase family protein [Aldersonia sp. NBC_00410]
MADDSIHVDHGLIGTDRPRPALTAAMSALSARDTLVVTSLDRVARSVADQRERHRSRGPRCAVDVRRHCPRPAGAYRANGVRDVVDHLRGVRVRPDSSAHDGEQRPPYGCRRCLRPQTTPQPSTTIGLYDPSRKKGSTQLTVEITVAAVWPAGFWPLSAHLQHYIRAVSGACGLRTQCEDRLRAAVGAG